MLTVDSDILVMIPDTVTNRLITSNYVFKIGMFNYEVIKPDDISRPGLLLLPMSFVNQEQIIPVVAEPEDEGISYILSGEDEITKGYSETFTATKYNNGVEVAGSFTFSIVAGSTPESAYTLTVVDGDECSITANAYIYSIVLRATDDDSGEYVEKTIRLVSLF